MSIEFNSIIICLYLWYRLPKGVAAGQYLQGSMTFARDELGKKATNVWAWVLSVLCVSYWLYLFFSLTF